MITKDSFHSSVAAELIDYISFKQALGRSFQAASFVLFSLDRFLCEFGSPPADLTEETFGYWYQAMESLSSNTKLARMHIVRNFCLYRRRHQPALFQIQGNFQKPVQGQNRIYSQIPKLQGSFITAAPYPPWSGLLCGQRQFALRSSCYIPPVFVEESCFD